MANIAAAARMDAPIFVMTSVCAGHRVGGAPGGIEPPTPSLPWNHREPLYGWLFPQVTPDRPGQSYRFSFSEVMRSLSSHVLIVRPAP